MVKKNINNEEEDSDFGFLDEVTVTENILNASYYLHICILEAIHALRKGIEKSSPKDGITLLLISTDQAENIAEAKDIIDRESDEYKKMIAEYKEKIKDEEDIIQKAKMANFKLGKLLVAIKEREPKTGNVIV